MELYTYVYYVHISTSFTEIVLAMFAAGVNADLLKLLRCKYVLNSWSYLSPFIIITRYNVSSVCCFHLHRRTISSLHITSHSRSSGSNTGNFLTKKSHSVSNILVRKVETSGRTSNSDNNSSVFDKKIQIRTHIIDDNMLYLCLYYLVNILPGKTSTFLSTMHLRTKRSENRMLSETAIPWNTLPTVTSVFGGRLSARTSNVTFRSNSYSNTHLSHPHPHNFLSSRHYMTSLPRTSSKDYDGELTELEEVTPPRPFTENEIRNFLLQFNSTVEQGHTSFFTWCPSVGKLKKFFTEESKLCINSKTGYFQCNHCGKRGEWSALEENLIAMKKSEKQYLKGTKCFKNVTSVENLTVETPAAVKQLLAESKNIGSLTASQFSEVQEVFGLQGLTVETFDSYGIRVKMDDSSLMLVLPVSSPGGTVVGVKLLEAIKSKEDGHEEILKEITKSSIPSMMKDELFGWKLYQPHHKHLILTASEVDAMAITQQTQKLAMALPKSHTMLPPQILFSLEKFDTVTLWLGNDVKSWEASKMFASKLNEKRSYLIRQEPGGPRPLDVLQRGDKLESVLKTARPLSHKSIMTFVDLRDEVYSEMTQLDQTSGVKWKRYPTLNKLLKGHRRGELTVFTGPTGAGKTTFISDYALDLCMQGVNTLWGSFEISNKRLMRIMLMQFARKNIEQNMHEFDLYAEKLAQLPMYCMAFHGQESVEKVLDTMSHGVYIHDIAHVIVDNLQFMMGVDTGPNRFAIQDKVIADFRRFATSKQCHVTLIIHPRKEDPGNLTMASIFGSAKATQEADNVLILQDQRLLNPRGKKFIQVAKNRFDGEVGVMLLNFDRESLSFAGKEKEVKPRKKKKQEPEEEEDG